MRKLFILLLSAAAFLPACNNPFQSAARARIELAHPDPPVYTGSPASVVELHGTATNSGTIFAHQVTITATVGKNSISRTSSPSDIGPGETATWSVKLAGSQPPNLFVSWR